MHDLEDLLITRPEPLRDAEHIEPTGRAKCLATGAEPQDRAALGSIDLVSAPRPLHGKRIVACLEKRLPNYLGR
jgi:hypothetical protein